MRQHPNFKLILLVIAFIILFLIVDFVFHLMGIHVLDYFDQL